MSSEMAASGPHVLRRMNAGAVLRALREAPGLTARVSDLTLATGLSRPAVTRALNTLRDASIVEVSEPTAIDMGRPAVLARFRAEFGHVAGVDVGPHKVVAMIADLTGRIRAGRQVPTPRDVTGPRLVDLLRRTLLDVAAEADLRPDELWSVGIGTPGVVDPGRGEVVLAPSIPGWTDLPVAADLRDWLGCPVLIDNDVNLAVVAERWRGESNSDNLLFVQWGERIGTGIVIDGKPHRGASSAAGELGFVDLVTPIDEEPPAATDQLGAFERLVGARAILQLAIERCDQPLRERLSATGEIAPLFEMAAAGDAAAVAVVDTIATRFARGLATQLLILDPEQVVIGGGVSRAGDILFDAVRDRLRRMLLVPVDLRVSTLGADATALGAVRAALDHADERLAALLRQSA